MLTSQNKTITTILIILLIILISCRKDPLTLPTEVYFEFKFVSYEEDDEKNQISDLKHSLHLTNPQGKLQIDGGTLIIESVAFDGRRKEGKDVFFTSNFSEPIIVDLKTESSNKHIKFDIPQGIYNKIDIDIEIGGNNNLSLVLEGNFKKGIFNDFPGPFEDIPGPISFEEFPVRFEYDINEQIRVKAKSGKNINDIILDKNVSSTAKIIIDAGSIFRLVNIGMIQNANLQVQDGKNIILINNENNKNIYSIISARLDKSFSIIID